MYEYHIFLKLEPSVQAMYDSNDKLVDALSASDIGDLLYALANTDLYPDAIRRTALAKHHVLKDLVDGKFVHSVAADTVWQNTGIDGKTVSPVGTETEVNDIRLELSYVSDSPYPLRLGYDGSGMYRCMPCSHGTLREWVITGWETTVNPLTTDGLIAMFYCKLSEIVYGYGRASRNAEPDTATNVEPGTPNNAEPGAPQKILPLHGTDEEHIIHPPVPKVTPAKPENKERNPLPLPVNKSDAYKAALHAAAKLDIKKAHAMLAAVGMIPDSLTVFDMYRKLMIGAVDAIDAWYEKKGGETVIPLKYDENAPAVFYARTVDMFGKWSMQVEFVPTMGSATFYA